MFSRMHESLPAPHHTQHFSNLSKLSFPNFRSGSGSVIRQVSEPHGVDWLTCCHLGPRRHQVLRTVLCYSSDTYNMIILTLHPVSPSLALYRKKDQSLP